MPARALRLVHVGKSHAHACFAELVLAVIPTSADRGQKQICTLQAALLASLDEDASGPPPTAVTSAKGKPKKKGKRTKAGAAAGSVAAFPALCNSLPASPASRHQSNSLIASQQPLGPRISTDHAAAFAAELGSVGRKPPSGQPHSPAAGELPQPGAAAQLAAGRAGGPGAAEAQDAGWVRIVKGGGPRRCADERRNARAMTAETTATVGTRCSESC